LALFSLLQYAGEVDLPTVMALVDAELSEPYSIFTYRYFLHTWPELCFLALDKEGKKIGCIVCKADMHRDHMRGYIAMVVVDKACRGKGLGRGTCHHSCGSLWNLVFSTVADQINWCRFCHLKNTALARSLPGPAWYRGYGRGWV
jgi:GNAT superfamily N-acetyltransferase